MVSFILELDGFFYPVGLKNKYNAPSTIASGKFNINRYEVALYEGNP